MKTFILLILVLSVSLFIAYYAYNAQFFKVWTSIYNFTGKNLPWLEPTLIYMQKEITAGSREGLAIYCFIGKIPVLPFPVEPYFLYVSSKGLSLFDIILYGCTFSTIGACVNYIFGYIFGSGIIRALFGDMSDWQEDLIQKLGSPMAFLASLLPLPDVTSMVFGAYRVNFIYFTIFTFAGLCLKAYALITGSYEAFNFLQKSYNVTAMFSLLGK